MHSFFTSSAGNFASQPQPPDPESLRMTGPDISLSNLSGTQDDGPQSLCLWCYGLGHTLEHCPQIFHYDYESGRQTDQQSVANNPSPVSETSSQAGGYSLEAAPPSVTTAVVAGSNIAFQNAQPDHNIHSYRNPASICPSSRPQENFYICCNYMSKEVLKGPLPSDDQTQAYLCEELGLPANARISLDLNEYLRMSQPFRSRAVPWTASVRIACMLAIWGSERRELTTDEILQALIDAIPYCHEHRHHANIKQPSGKKRGGWVATVVSTLSTSTIFVQKDSDGLRSKYWRLDVRGLNNCVRVCAHNKKRFGVNAGDFPRITG